MPIYEYKCPSCGKVSEVLVQGFFSPPDPVCPDCGGNMERRLSVPVAVTGKSDNAGKTCCGREERCEKPPCSGGQHCHRH
ncbi:MAG: zinc ribbon domain-containing protein [Dehalococcoidales bacterium]|jgi:putative FmdB family regulatory protein